MKICLTKYTISPEFFMRILELEKLGWNGKVLINRIEHLGECLLSPNLFRIKFVKP